MHSIKINNFSGGLNDLMPPTTVKLDESTQLVNTSVHRNILRAWHEKDDAYVSDDERTVNLADNTNFKLPNNYTKLVDYNGASFYLNPRLMKADNGSSYPAFGPPPPDVSDKKVSWATLDCDYDNTLRSSTFKFYVSQEDSHNQEGPLVYIGSGEAIVDKSGNQNLLITLVPYAPKIHLYVQGYNFTKPIRYATLIPDGDTDMQVIWTDASGHKAHIWYSGHCDDDNTCAVGLQPFYMAGNGPINDNILGADLDAHTVFEYLDSYKYGLVASTGHKLYFSELKSSLWKALNYLEFDSDIVGLVSARDFLYVFTKRNRLFRVSGNTSNFSISVNKLLDDVSLTKNSPAIDNRGMLWWVDARGYVNSFNGVSLNFTSKDRAKVNHTAGSLALLHDDKYYFGDVCFDIASNTFTRISNYGPHKVFNNQLVLAKGALFRIKDYTETTTSLKYKSPKFELSTYKVSKVHSVDFTGVEGLTKYTVITDNDSFTGSSLPTDGRLMINRKTKYIQVSIECNTLYEYVLNFE